MNWDKQYIKQQNFFKEELVKNKEDIHINEDSSLSKEESIKPAELNEIELKGKTEFYRHRSMLS